MQQLTVEFDIPYPEGAAFDIGGIDEYVDEKIQGKIR
jgi:hypothetical protein